MHRFSLEKFPNPKLRSEGRFAVKLCPCGKSNKDGKFVPFNGFENRGFCHSCETTYSVGCHTCPRCKCEYAFNRYLDSGNSNNLIDDNVGKCIICGYHCSPGDFFNKNPGTVCYAKMNAVKHVKTVKTSEILEKKVSFIDPAVFKKSLSGYESNSFISFLKSRFGEYEASEVVRKYFIGTSRYWPGSTIFWQIDSNGRIRSGKIMLYDEVTGKRSKEPGRQPTWAHKALRLDQYTLEQCFFGEHLLNARPTAPIAIVESEKTSVIASLYLPEFIWLACGGKTNLKTEKFKVLAGRNVVLYPDLNAFEDWSRKKEELSTVANIAVSDLLEKKSSDEEKKLGLDLADYLLRYPLKTPNDPLNILINELTSIPCKIMTGSEFNNSVIAWVKTPGGGDYEILFNDQGNPVTDKPTADSVAKFYKKNFVEVFVNNKTALAQINNTDK